MSKYLLISAALAGAVAFGTQASAAPRIAPQSNPYLTEVRSLHSAIVVHPTIKKTAITKHTTTFKPAPKKK